MVEAKLWCNEKPIALPMSSFAQHLTASGTKRQEEKMWGAVLLNSYLLLKCCSVNVIFVQRERGTAEEQDTLQTRQVTSASWLPKPIGWLCTETIDKWVNFSHTDLLFPVKGFILVWVTGLYLVLFLDKEAVTLRKDDGDRQHLCPILRVHLIHFSWYPGPTSNIETKRWTQQQIVDITVLVPPFTHCLLVLFLSV